MWEPISRAELVERKEDVCRRGIRVHVFRLSLVNCEGYEFMRSEQLQYRHRARSDALAARHIGENACRTVDAKFMTRIRGMD